MADIDLGSLRYKLVIDTSALDAAEKRLGAIGGGNSSGGGTASAGNISPGANVAAGGVPGGAPLTIISPGANVGAGGAVATGAAPITAMALRQGGAGGLMGNLAFAGAGMGVGGAGGAAVAGAGAGGGGGMRSNRLFRLGLVGAYDVGRALEAYADVNFPLPGQTAIQGIHRQQAALDRMQGGFFGSVAGGALALGDLASLAGGSSTSRPTSGFGILGRYSPYSARAAAAEAEEGLATTLSRQGVIEDAMDRRRGFIKERSDVAGFQVDNKFARERGDASSDFETFKQEMRDRSTKITEKMNLSQLAGDQKAYDTAALEQHELAVDAPGMHQRAEERMNARVNRQTRDELVYDLRNRYATSAANDIGDLAEARKPTLGALRGMQADYLEATASPAMMASDRQRETAEYRGKLREFRADYLASVRGQQVDGMGSIPTTDALGGTRESADEVLGKIAELLAQIERNTNGGGRPGGPSPIGP